MANLLFLVPRVKVVPAYLSAPSPPLLAVDGAVDTNEAREGAMEAGEEGRVEERREAMGQPPEGVVGKGEEEVVGMGGWSAGSSNDILLLCLVVVCEKKKREASRPKFASPPISSTANDNASIHSSLSSPSSDRPSCTTLSSEPDEPYPRDARREMSKK